MKKHTILIKSYPFRVLSSLAFLVVVTVNVATKAATQNLDPINLRSTEHFVVLAGSLVSNIPGSAITGDIGLSPATGSNITGFGRLEVTGIIYTIDASGPAGSLTAASDLSTAKGDLTLAYNEAAGRTPVPAGPFLNPGAGNIGGLTLEAGLYKFTSGLSILGSNLTLSGGPEAVWIFQIASDLVVANGVQVILAGGAQAANIFWQVGTSATLGTSSVFKGTILADQSISLNTGATLEGRALASIAAVTLASNAIVKPIRNTPVEDFRMAKSFGYTLKQNSHSLEFTVPSRGRVTLSLMNTSGKQIGKLFDGMVEAGYRTLVETGKTGFLSGICYAQLDFNGNRKLTKLAFPN